MILPFRTKVATLTIGNAVAQAIGLLAAALLMRLYSPDQFGTFSLYSGFVFLGVVFSSWQYENAIVLPGDPGDAERLVALCLMINGAMCLVFLVGIRTYCWITPGTVEQSVLRDCLNYLPWNILVVGLTNTMTYWFIRHERYKALARIRVAQTVMISLAQVAFAHWKDLQTGLIKGSVAGQAVVLGVMFFPRWREVVAGFSRQNVSSFRRVLREHSNFPRITIIHSLLDSIQNTATNYLLSRWFGFRVLGYYSQTLRFLKAPLGLVGGAISQAFYQEASKRHSRGEDIHSFFRRVLGRVTLFGALFFSVSAAAGPWAFSLLLGDAWRESGVFARLLAPWLFMNFICSPFFQVVFIFKKQAAGLVAGVLYNGILLGGILLLGWAGVGARGMFFSVSLAAALFFAFLLGWLLKISHGERAHEMAV